MTTLLTLNIWTADPEQTVDLDQTAPKEQFDQGMQCLSFIQFF